MWGHISKQRWRACVSVITGRSLLSRANACEKYDTEDNVAILRLHRFVYTPVLYHSVWMINNNITNNPTQNKMIEMSHVSRCIPKIHIQCEMNEKSRETDTCV